MKILMLVNWKIQYENKIPADKQPPDYYIPGKPYWFFRYFRSNPEVDVVDVTSFPWLEQFEKNKLRFYVWQSLKVLFKLNRYDLIVSHGMQSGVVLSLWRRFFKTKAKHIVFDIGSFNSAAESGFALKLMQFASKSIDRLIYHTFGQKSYYERFFPWLVDKSHFIRFGTDLEFFEADGDKSAACPEKYIVSIGAVKRDRDTLVNAYTKLNNLPELRMIGCVEEKYNGIPGVVQIPYIPVREMVEQIKGAAFCVLPLESFNYSYGQMTLMQQMALKKCVIAARVPSLVDYVTDGETAVLYNPCDAEELCAKMKDVLDNPEKCRRIAQQGREYLLNHCNEKIMAGEIEKVFASAL